jgi:hypothetical protein
LDEQREQDNQSTTSVVHEYDWQQQQKFRKLKGKKAQIVATKIRYDKK